MENKKKLALHQSRVLAFQVKQNALQLSFFLGLVRELSLTGRMNILYCKSQKFQDQAQALNSLFWAFDLKMILDQN